jgi:hypothetical protein
MAVRSNNPTKPVLNQTVSTSTPVKSAVLNMSFVAAPQVGYIVQVGAGLTATFNILVSIDNVLFVDSGQILPSVSGSALNFSAQYSGAFPYVLLQVTQSAGSGTVYVQACSKGVG